MEENEVLTRAAELLAQRADLEQQLRACDAELSKAILDYSNVSRTWGFDRFKMRIVCEMRGFLPKAA